MLNNLYASYKAASQNGLAIFYNTQSLSDAILKHRPSSCVCIRCMNPLAERKKVKRKKFNHFMQFNGNDDVLELQLVFYSKKILLCGSEIYI